MTGGSFAPRINVTLIDADLSTDRSGKQRIIQRKWMDHATGMCPCTLFFELRLDSLENCNFAPESRVAAAHADVTVKLDSENEHLNVEARNGPVSRSESRGDKLMLTFMQRPLTELIRVALQP